jgi:hypothetical protein
MGFFAFVAAEPLIGKLLLFENGVEAEPRKNSIIRTLGLSILFVTA